MAAHDLKLALRLCAARPAFSLMVIGMLSLGIAGNSTIFSIFDGLFLRPLPFAEPDRLVDLNETAPKWNLPFVDVSNPDFYAWRQHNTTFDSMGFFAPASYNLSGRGTARRLRANRVTADLMRVLRMKAVAGRNFLPEEDRPGGAPVAMLGYGIWRELFAGNPEVAGQIIRLDGQPHTVVGVLPPEASFPEAIDLWVPLAADPNRAGSWYLRGIGRLKSGVTVEQARADLTRIHQAQIQAGRKENAITSPTVMPLRDRYVGELRTAGNVLLGAVGIVLLIACANIAGLMMIRAAGRSREVAIRTALGASRTRIVRQLLTESMVYAAAGGMGGLLLGKALLRLLVSAMPEVMPWVRFEMDHRTLLFLAAVTGAAAVLFGLTPALQAASSDLRTGLHDAARSSVSRGRRRMLSTLVVGEIALAMVLAVAAALMFQALRNVMKVDPGFRPENVLAYSISLPRSRYPAQDTQTAFLRELLKRTRALPGVKSAGAAQLTPLDGRDSGTLYVPEDAPPPGPDQQHPIVLDMVVSPGYFAAMGMRMASGRDFTDQDTESAPRVAVIDETFAKRFFPHVNPVGKRIRHPWAADERIVIAGVTRDVKHFGLDREVRPSVFLNYRQYGLRDRVTIVLRTGVDPVSLAAPAREALRRMDPELAMFDVVRMTEAVDRSLWVRRICWWVAGAFAGLALVMSAAGIYGVISYAVSQRSREIGIRMALGAPPALVLRHVLGQGLLMLAAGLPIGIAAALSISSFVEKLLFGVKARDPITYAVMAALVAGIALAANWIPARRAAAIDPMHALRSE